jgi:hypothetical protein
MAMGLFRHKPPLSVLVLATIAAIWITTRPEIFGWGAMERHLLPTLVDAAGLGTLAWYAVRRSRSVEETPLIGWAAILTGPLVACLPWGIDAVAEDFLQDPVHVTLLVNGMALARLVLVIWCARVLVQSSAQSASPWRPGIATVAVARGY